MTDYKRLTINLSEEMHAQLQEMAAQQQTTVSHLLRRAVALEKFFWDHRDEEVFLKKDDETREVLLPR